MYTLTRELLDTEDMIVYLDDADPNNVGYVCDRMNIIITRDRLIGYVWHTMPWADDQLSGKVTWQLSFSDRREIADKGFLLQERPA